MTTTPLQILRLAFKDAGVLGVGQSLLDEDYSDGLATLNQMLAEWATQRWLVYHLRTLSVTSTGAESYSIGPQCDFDITPRPDKLESAFLRQPSNVGGSGNNVDYPMRIIQSREEYNRISLKSLVSFSNSIFYDVQWPTGTLYPYPVPNASIYQLFVSVKEPLSQIAPADIGRAYDIPDNYFGAMRYNLALRFRVSYPGDVPQPDALPGLARATLNILRASTFQIDQLQIPKELVRPGIYNWQSDQTY